MAELRDILASGEILEIYLGSTNASDKVVVQADLDVVSAAIPTDTDDLPEGSVNEYYTEAKVSANADVVANTAKETNIDHPLVETAVPVGAVFTDTTYTDAEIKVKYENNADTNAFTDAEKTKLALTEEGAEVNVQSDWTENGAGEDSYILNKPSIPSPQTYLHADLTDTATDGHPISAITNLQSELNGKAEWKDTWTSVEYQENDMVRDGDWTMIANKTTTDRAAPQTQGEPYNIFTGTLVSANEPSATQIVFGTRYTPTEDKLINSYRVYTIANQEYIISTVEDPDGAPIIKEIIRFTAQNSGWRTFPISPIIIGSGTEFELLIIVSNPSAGETPHSAQYTYTTQQNETVPGAGEITHATKALDTLRVNKNGNTFLDSIDVGDTVGGAGMDWEIISVTDSGSYYEYNIVPAVQGNVSGSAETFTFTEITPTIIEYYTETSFYRAFPDVSGIYGTDSVPRALNDNAYGADLELQDIYTSPDWDVVAHSANLAGVGDSGDDGLTDAPSDGNLYGRKDALWEIIPDSYVLYDVATDTYELTPTADGQTLNLGQEMFFSAVNQDITDATALDPKVFKSYGAVSGDEKFHNVIKVTAADVAEGTLFGLNTTDIIVGGKGKIATYGLLNNVNTLAWPLDAVLYIDTIAGELTNIQPAINAYAIGKVNKVDATTGIIYVTAGSSSRIDTEALAVGISRINFTGDEVTTTEGTFFLALSEDEGTVTTATNELSVNDDQTIAVPQDHITETYTQDQDIRTGIRDGMLEWMQSNNRALEQFVIEVYLTDVEGAVIDSGIATEPVGDLGVRTVFSMSTSLMDAEANAPVNSEFRGLLEAEFTIPTNHRLRFHTLCSKVGGAGGAKNFVLYYGSNQSTYVNAIAEITIDDVIGLPEALDEQKYREPIHTGLSSGGNISQGIGPLDVDIEQGTGSFVDSLTDPLDIEASTISWSGSTLTIIPGAVDTQEIHEILMGADLIPFSIATHLSDGENLSAIRLGFVELANNANIKVNAAPYALGQTALNVDSMYKNLEPEVLMRGLRVNPSSDLGVYVEAGAFPIPGINWHIDPANQSEFIVSQAGDEITPVTLQIFNQNSVPILIPQSSMPKYYDNAGTLESLTGNEAVIHYIFVSSAGYSLQLGNKIYTDFSSAFKDACNNKSTFPYAADANIPGRSPLIAQVIVSNKAENFNNSSLAHIISIAYGETGNTVSPIDLTLVPQYLLNVKAAENLVANDLLSMDVNGNLQKYPATGGESFSDYTTDNVVLRDSVFMDDINDYGVTVWLNDVTTNQINYITTQNNANGTIGYSGQSEVTVGTNVTVIRLTQITALTAGLIWVDDAGVHLVIITIDGLTAPPFMGVIQTIHSGSAVTDADVIEARDQLVGVYCTNDLTYNRYCGISGSDLDAPPKAAIDMNSCPGTVCRCTSEGNYNLVVTTVHNGSSYWVEATRNNNAYRNLTNVVTIANCVSHGGVEVQDGTILSQFEYNGVLQTYMASYTSGNTMNVPIMYGLGIDGSVGKLLQTTSGIGYNIVINESGFIEIYEGTLVGTYSLIYTSSSNVGLSNTAIGAMLFGSVFGIGLLGDYTIANRTILIDSSVTRTDYFMAVTSNDVLQGQLFNADISLPIITLPREYAPGTIYQYGPYKYQVITHNQAVLIVEATTILTI